MSIQYDDPLPCAPKTATRSCKYWQRNFMTAGIKLQSLTKSYFLECYILAIFYPPFILLSLFTLLASLHFCTECSPGYYSLTKSKDKLEDIDVLILLMIKDTENYYFVRYLLWNYKA